MRHGEKCIWQSNRLRDILDGGARLLGPLFEIHVAEEEEDTPCKIEIQIRGIRVEISYLPYGGNLTLFFIGTKDEYGSMESFWSGQAPPHLLADGEQRDMGPLVTFAHNKLIEHLMEDVE